MKKTADVEIWPAGEGILDLPDNLAGLELPSMRQLRQSWQMRRAELEGTEVLRRFSNEIAIEWAIETGQIENLYDLERGVTMSLIEQGVNASLLERGATNKPPEYVVALIKDQQDALQGLFDFVKGDRVLSTGYIKEIHAAMTRSQLMTEAVDQNGNRIEVPLLRGEWKQTPNYPLRDGKRFLYCPVDQTQPQMEKLVSLHLEHESKGVPPEVEAAWLHHRFTQIHPFQDGNGRIARALASLVLVRAEMFPFIMPSEEKGQYLDALEAADGGNLRPLILTIARHQQRALIKANNMIARLSPDPRTAIEAANALAQSITLSKKARSARANLRVDNLHTWTQIALDRKIKDIAKIFLNADPSSRIQSHGGSSLTSVENLSPIAYDLDGSIEAPAMHSKWSSQTPVDWTLKLFVASLADDLDERVVAFTVLERKKKQDENLRFDPIYYGIGDEAKVIEKYAESWADEIWRTLFNYLRKENATA